MNPGNPQIMHTTIPRTSFLRASALGTSKVLPRRTALQMWALSGRKNAWKDLVSILTDDQEKSTFRVLAASLLAKKDSVKTSAILLSLLQYESHPRMIRTAIELIGLNGQKKAYQELEQLFLSRNFPGSSREAMLMALRLLKHRWGLDTGLQLDSQSVPATARSWGYKSFPIHPATGKSFNSALKSIDKQLPSIPVDQGFGAAFPCGDKQMVLMLTPAFNQVHEQSSLWHRPGIMGILLEQTEEGPQHCAWVFSSPTQGSKLQINVYHVDGRKLYTGTGEMVEDAFHYTITTIEGAGLPVMLLSGGFRKNQILNDGLLRIAIPETDTIAAQTTFAQSA